MQMKFRILIPIKPLGLIVYGSCFILRDQLVDANNKGKELYVLGDININLLNCNTENKTSGFLHMLLDTGFIPLITKATRITDHTSTLIDHIYTNVPQKNP